MEIWQRWLLVAAIIAGATVLAKIVDWRMSRHDLPPGAVTRYRVLRRSLMTAIIVVGVLSALLVVPQVRAIAAGLLASIRDSSGSSSASPPSARSRTSSPGS